MNRKQALIVDDSKTAQYLLKRMLQKYDLLIDVVSSAEEALAYLSYNHPAVIFLDQQMTGMTGIEALKTIKANPHTALIPVIMYTSQKDDLFVSQAIALGAQGILSKSALQPSNLQQVLSRLNIRRLGDIQDEEAEEAEASAASNAKAVAGEPQPATALAPSALPELDRVRQQIGRLFELHMADIRSQINNSTQLVIKRLSTNIEKSANREASVGNQFLATIKTSVSSAMASERQQKSHMTHWFFGVTLVMMALLGYTLLQMQAESEASTQKILASLQAREAEKPSLMAAALSQMPSEKVAQTSPRAIHPSLLQAISWAQTADFQFEYGEQPLTGARLANLHQLVYLLAEAGYRGALSININFGNFCLDQDEAHTFRLARSEARLSSCKLQKDVNSKFTVSDYITLQYQAFEKNLAPIQDGRISLRLVTNGMATSRVDYPLVTPQTTAGEWNRAALRNNRIAVQFPE